MTEENRRRNLREEVERAEQALRAAETLTEQGLHADAVSRAYYAAFHLLRALLFARGVEPRFHRGAIQMFNREFVRPGTMNSGHNRLLAVLQRSRELADYDAAVAFSADDAQRQIEDARAFREASLDLLRREGWLASPANE